MADAVRLRGFSELQRSLGKINREVKRDLGRELKAVAEPVRATAETLAQQNISHLGASWARGGVQNVGAPWSRMRIGVTSKVVYVAPFQRNHGGSPRPNLAGLLMDKAMQPALDQHEGEVRAAVGFMFDRISAENGF